MRLLLALALPLLLCSFVRAEEDDADVIVLTKDNFESIVNPAELILVEFYAPWCGHCKSLAPEYAQAATILKDHVPPIPLAKVDATAHSELAGKYGVSGYPTLFIFRNGKESKYSGPRKADGIVAHMKKQVGPAARPLTSHEEIKDLVNVDALAGYAVVGFFSATSSQLLSAFSLLTNRMREDFVFGKVTDPALFKEYGVEGEAIVAFKTFDDKQTIYTGPTKTKDVENWIKAHSLPLVGNYAKEKEELYFRRGLPVAKLYVGVDLEANPKQGLYFTNRLKKAATDFRDQIVVTIVNKNKAAGDLEAVGLQNQDVALLIEKQGRKYVSEEPFSAASVYSFFQNFLADKVPVHVKSEPEPADNTGPVTILTGKNFDSIVNDPSKNVLVEFYAPWCGHCKSLEPKYKKLGEKVRNSKKLSNVVIAKMDATANDYPADKFKVSGYPTIYLKRAGSSTPILYEGDRETADIFNWISDRAKLAKKKKSTR